jgi:hypothetical protein
LKYQYNIIPYKRIYLFYPSVFTYKSSISPLFDFTHNYCYMNHLKTTSTPYGQLLNKLIDTLLKLGVIVVLIVAAATKQQISFYTFVRWVVLASFVYFAYKSYISKQMGLLIYFSLVVLLFNPFKPLWFQKETWHLIDYLIAAITAATVIMDWTLNNKQIKMTPRNSLTNEPKN